MELPFLAKLGAAADNLIGLQVDDKALLERVCGNVHTVLAHRDIVREAEAADHVHLIVNGWAGRYKIMPDGSRQIMALMIPGDFCDPHVTIFGEMDHSIATFCECQVAIISPEGMSELTGRPPLARALWWATLVDEAVLRSWICNLGRRDALTRLAHLICELHARLEMVGLVADLSFALPLTQEDLADALGLTPVHINRMLKRLRGSNLLTLSDRMLTILDLPGLQKAAGFDANYLHLPRRPQVQQLTPTR